MSEPGIQILDECSSFCKRGSRLILDLRVRVPDGRGIPTRRPGETQSTNLFLREPLSESSRRDSVPVRSLLPSSHLAGSSLGRHEPARSSEHEHPHQTSARASAARFWLWRSSPGCVPPRRLRTSCCAAKSRTSIRATSSFWIARTCGRRRDSAHRCRRAWTVRAACRTGTHIEQQRLQGHSEVAGQLPAPSENRTRSLE